MANMGIVQVRGIGKLQQRLIIIPKKLEKELNKAAEKSAVVIKKRAATYPRQRPNSTYRRTNTLGRRWQYRVKDGSAIVYNRTRYGKWVMGREDQASIHRGKWARTDQIAEEMKQKTDGFYEHAIEQGLK